jgi:hypothetical protein
MAKSNLNFYLLQEDSGEIIGIVGTPNIKERVRSALQDYFNNKEINIEDITFKLPTKKDCERGWVHLPRAVFPFTLSCIKVY